MIQHRLSEIDVQEISFVKKPAVKKAYTLLQKSADGYDITKIEREIIQKNDIEGKVYFYALVPNEADLQGDIVSGDEIKKGVDKFNENLANRLQKGTGVGVEHTSFPPDLGYPILNIYDENGEIAKSLGVATDKIIKGAWLTGIQLTPQGIKKFSEEKYEGVSIGGHAIRKAIENQVQKNENGLLEALKELIGIKKNEQKQPQDNNTELLKSIELLIQKHDEESEIRRLEKTNQDLQLRVETLENVNKSLADRIDRIETIQKSKGGTTLLMKNNAEISLQTHLFDKSEAK